MKEKLEGLGKESKGELTFEGKLKPGLRSKE